MTRSAFGQRLSDVLRRSRLREQRARRAALGRFRTALRAEISRSRRYDRRFVLMRVPILAVPTANTRARLHRAVQELLRTSDVACLADHELYLLLPESDRAAGIHCFERLRGTLGEGLMPSRAVIVAFPDDAVTIGSLLAALRVEPASREVVGQSSPVPLGHSADGNA